MHEFLSKILSTCSAFIVGLLLLINTAVAGTILVPATASAAYLSCVPSMSKDQDSNIIYNGIAGSDANSMRSNLKTTFDSNNGGNCHTDLQAVYSAALGATTALSDTMLNDAAGWTLGYTTHDGNITTDGGVVVGTNTQVFSRCWKQNITPTNCEPSSQYTKVLDETSGKVLGVYSHSTMWWMNDGNVPERTLIHINATTGQADFAVWKDCGNALRFTPTPPKSSLVCKQLDTPKLVSQEGTSFTYSFTVTAEASYTSNITYTIDYGDGSSDGKGVTDGTKTVTFTHVYKQLEVDKEYTISAKVNNQPQVDACQKKIKIPAKGKLSFACLKLDAKLTSSTDSSRTYSFTATTQGTDSAKTYMFVFGDGNSTTDQASNLATHTYTFDKSKNNSFSGYFVSTSNTGLKTDQSDIACQFSFSTQLVRTGPGDTLAIVAVASTLGIGLHQLVLRRRLA